MGCSWRVSPSLWAAVAVHPAHRNSANEALFAKRSEIVGGEWTIPAPRYKTKIDHLVALSQAAQAVLQSLGGNGDGLIFTVNGTQAIGNHTHHKAAIDQLAECGIGQSTIFAVLPAA